MVRLNNSAFEILHRELERCNRNTPIHQVQYQLALKRLEKLRLQPGTPMTESELSNTLDDLFPNFDAKVLRRAAKANRPSSPWWTTLKVGTIALGGMVGGIWFLNLPYPMIRYPVARTIPMVLLPSFISMDHHYRQAIATTEQANQLVNKATSPADFELGATKVKAAQGHLDALPVWFLGYYPSGYCGLFGCTWRFTLDEFQQARRQVAGMEARLFQENNAQTQLQQADMGVTRSKQAYGAASNQSAKDSAIAQWQQGMDQLEEVPRETLAGRTAATKLKAYKRDFQQVVGFGADNLRSGNLIQAAKFAAETAQKFSTGNAQEVVEWQEAEKLWNGAIDYLKGIKPDDPDFNQAQKLLSQYESKRSSVRVRLEQQQQSIQSLKQAQDLQAQLTNSIQPGTKFLKPQEIALLRKIENTLKEVKPSTTVYKEAQTILKYAQARLK